MSDGNEPANQKNGFKKTLPSLKERILSIPIFLKIMGIGFLVAILFGSVTLFQTRTGTSRILSQLLEQKILTTTGMLADAIEPAVRSGDTEAILRHLEQAGKIYPEMRYAVVRYPDGRVMASTFTGTVPDDILNITPASSKRDRSIRIYKSGEGTIYEDFFTLRPDGSGTLQSGFIDNIVSQGLKTFTGTVLWGLLLCLTIGALLALLLTNILTRPIRFLMESSNRIREGTFETRARIYSNDEIGRLAIAFNQMAEALQKYQQEAKAKEEARVSLIERIVQVQEDERKSISRELHDHLGQSLLAILLRLQSASNEDGVPAPVLKDVEKSIRQAIDEIHRLAWGMRPSILDDYGFDSALARHIEELSRHSGLEIDYNYSCPPDLERLPGRIEVCLFRIAQEALTNIQKHAGASHASVVVLRKHKDITLLVEDDGRGFNLSTLYEKRNQGMGLIGIRERVALLGGSVNMESVPGEGTAIRVIIPAEGGASANPHIDS